MRLPRRQVRDDDIVNRAALAAAALAVLRENDTGRFVKPSPRLYPFQWNWDSAFVAIGLAGVDPQRARTEVRSLLEGQWTDGMVPHIVFHLVHADYRPGPELWDSASCAGAPDVPTSGLTQPPVLASAVRVLHETDPDRAFLEEVVPALEAWHAWFHRERTVDGLVALLHPWESADNSPRFDAALARVDVEGVEAPRRTDTSLVDTAERPTDLDYRRYIALVAALRAVEYRPSSPGAMPFAYVDLLVSSILAVAEDDLAMLHAEIGGDGTRARAAADRKALASTWDDDVGAYREHDLHDDASVTETVADLFPLYAGISEAERVARLVHEHLLEPSRFGPSPDAPWMVTTVSKASGAFDPRNYWRGPVWMNVNWFFIRGLERSGMAAEAAELRKHTLDLVSRSGFFEYYEPRSGAALGTPGFSWSAALTLDLLRDVRP
jgi:glycogen debranching enzyme